MRRVLARFVHYRLTIALVLAVAAITTSIFLIAKQASDNATATQALCALRANLERRGEQSNDFLRENPTGAGGISRAVIVKSIRDTRQTLHALRPLKC